MPSSGSRRIDKRPAFDLSFCVSPSSEESPSFERPENGVDEKDEGTTTGAI